MSRVSFAVMLLRRRLRPGRWIVAQNQRGMPLVHRHCHREKHVPDLDCSSGTISTRLPVDNEMVRRNVRRDTHGYPALYSFLVSLGSRFFGWNAGKVGDIAQY